MRDGLLARLNASEDKISLGKLDLYFATLRQGGWMLFATLLAGMANYFSNAFVGRRLGPADYGVFTSMLSLSMVTGAIVGVIQTAVTYFVARLQGEKNLASVRALLIYLVKRLLLWGVGGTVLLSLCAKPLGVFLQVSPLTIIVTALSLVPTALLPVINGALGGLQRFGGLGAVLVGAAVFRLATAMGLILLDWGVLGAVASLPLSGLGAFVLGVFFLVDVLRNREHAGDQQFKGALETSIHVALGTICFALLTYSDMIIVKSRFAPTDAGLYSAVATLGKLTLFPSVMATLLLAKATEKHARGWSTTASLRKTQLAVGLLCGAIAAALFVSPTFLVGTLFGEQYVAHASYLGLYSFAMMLYALVNVWLIYYLAIDEKRYTFVLLAGAALLVALLIVLSFSLTQVVLVLVGVGIVLNLAGEALFQAGKWRIL